MAVKTIQMTIGEPRHAQPDFVGPVLAANLSGFGVYPPNDGTPELLAEWRREAGPDREMDGHITPQFIACFGHPDFRRELARPRCLDGVADRLGAARAARGRRARAFGRARRRLAGGDAAQ